MASNSTLVYSVKINGLDLASNQVENLNSSIVNLGDTFVEVNAKGDLSQVNSTLQETSDSVNKLDDNLSEFSENTDKNFKNVGDSLDKFGNKTTITAEKVDKFSAGAEKGFKGISDALRLFGVDTTILDNVKESLGALGDLLDSQSKITDVAFDTTPIVEQAKAIGDLEKTTVSTTVATEAGAAAQTAAGTATKGATFATQALNVALRALPWLAVLGAITAVIAIISKWNQSQKTTVKSFEENLKGLKDQIDGVSDRYQNLIQTINQGAAKQQVDAKNTLNTLNAQLQVLESQGASADKIAAQKKLILQQEQLVLQQNIESQKQSLTTTEESIKFQKENLKNIKDEIFLREEAITLGIKTGEEAKKTEEEITKLKEQQTVVEGKINDLSNNSKNISNDILSTENDLNVSRTFGLKIINAQTKAQKDALTLQQQQLKLQLDEEQRKLNQQIEEGKKSIAEFTKESENLLKNLRDAAEQDEINLQIKLGNIDAAIKNITNAINDIPNDIDIRTEEIEKQLTEPFKKIAQVQSESLQAALDQYKSRLKEFSKAGEVQIEQFLFNIEQKLEKFKGDIILKIQGGEDLTNINQTITTFFENIRKQAEKDFKLGKISEKDLNEINSSLSSAEEALKGFAKAQQDINNIKTDGLGRSAATAEVLSKKFDELANSTKNLNDIISNSFNDISKEVNDTLESISKEADKNPFQSLFKGFFSKEQRDELKNKIDLGVQEGLKKLKEAKEKLKEQFEELVKIDPKAAENLKPLFDAANKSIDDGAKNLVKSGENAKDNVNKTFSDTFSSIIDNLEFWVRKFEEIFNAFNELETVRLDNQLSELEDYYENRNSILESQIEQEQIYADRQTEIISESTSRLNELEGQLQNARGSRATFLQKLRAEEQARLQKAEAERIASANRQKKLEDEQRKLEQQKAIDLENVERKKFEIQKRANIANIIINTAFAVARALADIKGPPTTFILAGIAGALGAVQLAAASAAKFAKGGLLEGPSHNNGGIPIMVNGGRLVEAEGGEYIINKESTKNNFQLLDTINKNPDRRFQRGGMLPSSNSLNAPALLNRSISSAAQSSSDLDRIVNTLTDNLSNISVQASIQDIRDVNAINMQIDDLRRI